MKTSIVVGFALVLGAGLGIGIAVVQTEYLAPWQDKPSTDRTTAAGSGEQEAAALAPKVIVAGNATYDFGVMEDDATGKHVFQIRNEGSDTLHLRKGATTCQCVTSMIGATSDNSDIEKDVNVPPGGLTEATIQWKTKGFRGDFEQSAVLKTNDPQRPDLRLKIKGRVLEAYVVTPPTLEFGGIPGGEARKAEVKILVYRKAPLVILGTACSNTETARFFEVTHEPLSAEEVVKEKHARNGYRLHITVKPGLPSGRFLQRILLTTSTEKGARKVEIPTGGAIHGELSIVGADWKDSAQMLSLGLVSRETGTEQTLRILARGPHRNEVKFKLVSAVPDLLQVSIGEAKKSEDGEVTQTPVTIRIPKGSRLAHFLGPEDSNLGHITLETNYPSEPQLRILVRFAVAK